jgi:hypothetical protein
MRYCYLPYSPLPSHPLFVWTFSSRRSLVGEGDVQTRVGSTQIGYKGLCVRGETEATPSDDYGYSAGIMNDAAYLTTKDMSDPHFVVIDHIGQMISRELVRFEQYRVGR